MITGTIVYKGGSLGKRINGLKPAVKDALIDAIKMWHSSFLHFHFEPGASSRYPGVYKGRSATYERQKAQKYGNQPDMVYSGELRELTLRTISVSGTSKQARGRLPGARKANFHVGQYSPAGGLHPDMPKEITALNNQEIKAMAAFVHDRIAKFLDSDDGPIETVKF